MRSILQLGVASAVELPVRTVAALIALLTAHIACAQLQYRVEIEAPAEMAQTLRQGLNLARWQNDPQMSAEPRRRLAEDAVRESRETAATEGYFSSRVDVRNQENPEQWIVHLTVDPGARTRVAEVDIEFRGPATADEEAGALL